jgi:hypothetical protein
MKAKAAFYFYLWRDIVGKKVSKVRSIAKLRAFYGTVVKIIVHLRRRCSIPPFRTAEPLVEFK